MKNIAVLLFLSFFIAGCEKPHPLCAGCGSPMLFQGQITASLNDTVSIESAFHLLDSLSLSILAIQGFTYNSSWPPDSLATVNNYLKSRSYIDSMSKAAFIYPVASAVINVRLGFLTMNLASQQDWVALKNQMELVDISDSMKVLYIQVPAGQEQSWADSLNKYPIIKRASPIWLAP